jgi:hypothetical protein
MQKMEAKCRMRLSAANPRETCLEKLRLNAAPDQTPSVQGGSRLSKLTGTHVSGEMLE